MDKLRVLVAALLIILIILIVYQVVKHAEPGQGRFVITMDDNTANAFANFDDFFSRPFIFPQEPQNQENARNMQTQTNPKNPKKSKNSKNLKNEKNEKNSEIGKNLKSRKKIFDDMVTHQNDSQNSHDPVINSILANKYARLVELYDEESDIELAKSMGISYQDEFQESKIKSAINELSLFGINKIKSSRKISDESKSEKLERFDIVIKKISSSNEKSVSISKILDDSGNIVPVLESWVLTLVWDRIMHPDNDANRKQLQNTLVKQLIDATEKNLRLFHMIDAIMTNTPIPDSEFYPVCVNGRISRMLSVFTLLDADPELSKPELDHSEIANLAYSRSSQILNSELESQNMEKLYNSDYDSLSAENQTKVDRFCKHVRSRIESELRVEFGAFVKEDIMNDIIEKAKCGVS